MEKIAVASVWVVVASSALIPHLNMTGGAVHTEEFCISKNKVNLTEEALMALRTGAAQLRTHTNTMKKIPLCAERQRRKLGEIKSTTALSSINTKKKVQLDNLYCTLGLVG